MSCVSTFLSLPQSFGDGGEKKEAKIGEEYEFKIRRGGR